MKIDIHKEDVLKVIYFISAITQSQNGGSMQGALSSKGDLMGGIFDRWINLIPENLIFNKILLPKLASTKDVKIITDFYMYNPKKAGIAPDVIGISVDGTSVPFAEFDEEWRAVDDKPQIEVKTFKESQYMVSLRNQHYDGKYLVMAETNLRIDYLIPFFADEVFDSKIFEQLKMDDSVFIKSNKEQLIAPAFRINTSNNTLGTVSLLKVTDVESFKNISTHCEANTSVKYIKSITESVRGPVGERVNVLLSSMCIPHPSGIVGLYRFIAHDDAKCLTLDFSVDDISALTVIRELKNSMYVKASSDVVFNGYNMAKGKIYKIEMQVLDRSSNNGEEYFLQKDLVNLLFDKEDELITKLQSVVDNV